MKEIKISPELMEAKINLEQTRKNYLGEYEADSYLKAKLLEKFNHAATVYDTTLIQEAKTLGIPSFVVKYYIDRLAKECSDEEGWDWVFLNGYSLDANAPVLGF